MSRKREATKHPALYPVVLPKVGEFVPATVWKEKDASLARIQGMIPRALEELERLVSYGQPDGVRLNAIRLLIEVVGLGDVHQEQPRTPLTVNVGMFNVDGKVEARRIDPDRPV